MKITRTISESKVEIKKLLHPIAFVPTMGALHTGHLELVRLAKRTSKSVVVSIFVNPTQFNNPEDLKRYPSTVQQDLDLLIKEHVDLVFLPSVEEMYPNGLETKIHPPLVADKLEGKFRPGHFSGVCSIVYKLFEIVDPDYAIFGEKDFQQVRVLEEMIKEHNLKVKLIRCPTVRQDNGLALSSRNRLLTSETQSKSYIIYASLLKGKKLIDFGEKNPNKIRSEIVSSLQASAEFEIEYLEIVSEDSLETVSEIIASNPIRVLIAVKIDGLRLIDNLKLV